MTSQRVSKILLRNSSALAGIEYDHTIPLPNNFDSDHFFPAIEALYENPKQPGEPGKKEAPEMTVLKMTPDPQEARAELKSARTKKQFATTPEVFQIMMALNAHCSKGDDGFAVYKDDMTDGKLVDEVIMPALAKAGVPHDPSRRAPIFNRLQAVRRQTFGDLIKRKPAKEAGEATALEARVDALEIQVRDLMRQLGLDAH